MTRAAFQGRPTCMHCMDRASHTRSTSRGSAARRLVCPDMDCDERLRQRSRMPQHPAPRLVWAIT